ncbi:MAG: protein translocase subunit SecD [Gemmataceae bacterium]
MLRRNFLTPLLICLVPTLLAAVAVGRGFVRESNGDAGFRRGIDLAGGTILVYEVNLERTLARSRGGDPNQPAGLDSDQIRRLAESLKRRIDPNDLQNVVVRPVGTTRVEIILPFAGSTGGGKKGANEDFVQNVKALVRQVGVLEFRILANSTDDREGLEEARRIVNDPANKADLESRAKAGLPPTAPRAEYTVTVNGNTQEGVTYEWVELGKEERDSLNLSNAFGTDTPPLDKSGKPRDVGMYQVAAQNRDKAEVLPNLPGLIYSRKFVKLAPSKDEEGKQVEYFMLTRVSPSDAMKVDRDVGLNAFPDTDSRTLDPAVRFTFNATGANRFGRMTERNRPDSNGFKRHLAIIMDDKIVSAPFLAAVLREGGQISGGSFDMGAVTRLVYILKSGALNAELKPDPVSENTVGPTLGQDTIRRGLVAVGLSFAAVLAFMVVYYRFAGLVACLALFVNLLLTVGFMVAVNAAFTLPGLAGIVLMLGMAVDANVLIYERLREERAKGANLATAIRLGYDRAFGTILDTHLTSIFTAIVLYTFGNDNLKGFAVSLTVGLVISLFTSLYMTRLMFDYWLHRRWLTELRMRQLFPRPNFDFMKIRHLMFAVTGFLTVAGLGLFLYRGEAGLNVDFTKGTAYGGRLVEGQERALNRSSDGKLGLLDLLGEARQKERLAVKDVVWLTKPAADDDAGTRRSAAGSDYVYKVLFADGSEATVTLANKPDGATEADQLADVKARAAALPGLSVEQVFIGGESFPDAKSRSFTVRTPEREPDLVQVSQDRLLREEKTNDPLLAGAKVVKTEVNGPMATLTLDRPAAPGYLKGYILRELRLAGRVPAVGGAPAVDVAGVPTEGDVAVSAEEGRTGRFKTVRVDVGKNPEFKLLADAAAAKDKAPADPKVAAEQADLKRVLDSAVKAFEARPVPERLETFDPALAADTRNKALYAVLASWMAILAYLWFRFGNWTFGLAAVLCLIHDLCFTLGAIAVCHYLYDTTFGHLLGLHDFKIDLAAVAALLTLVGYSVNDTIVVFDRIREVRGKNPVLTPQMINDSVNQTLSRTVLASLTVFLVVGVLYWFGGEGVHLFAFVMVFGVIVGTYSSIYIASPLLLIFGEGRPRTPDRLPAGRPTEATTA